MRHRAMVGLGAGLERGRRAQAWPVLRGIGTWLALSTQPAAATAGRRRTGSRNGLRGR